MVLGRKAISLPIWRFRSSRLVIPNRNDKIYLLGHVPGLHLSGHVSGRISAHMPFQKLLFGDSESYRYDLSFGTRFGTIYLNNQKWKYWIAMGCLLLFRNSRWIAHPMDHPTVPRTVG